MKKKAIIGIIGIIILVGLIALFSTPERKTVASVDDVRELISTEANSPSMSYNDFVTNTVKSYLKNDKKTFIETLGAEDKQLSFIQSPIIHDGFNYLTQEEADELATTDESGYKTVSVGVNTPTKFSFFAATEGYAPFPVFFVLDGDYQDSDFAYTATAPGVSQELPVSKEFSQHPTYDAGNDVTKGLIIFELPVQEYPENMSVDLAITVDGETFS